MNEDDIVRFGDLPFDNFVVEHWDPFSDLPKDDQKWSLVERWIKIGERGRKQYFERVYYDHEIPAHIPRGLLTPRERAADGQYSKTLWLRTWFGERDNTESQRAADDVYNGLSSFDDLERNGVDGDQRLLIRIADQKACQEGWVLLLGVKHKGQILPHRVRERATFVDLIGTMSVFISPSTSVITK
ncbi:hypothetical protein BJX99DRAFT_253592 [Aspergillus californicus]